jgi:DNA-directed RNA polymerase subunit F
MARQDTAISESDERFALEYLANGYNAKQAYLAVHPKASSATAEVQGSRLLRKPKVESFLAAERAARKKRLTMEGDEALEAITRIARGNIQQLFDAQGKLLKVIDMPADVADTVKSLKPTPHGTTIVLFDKLKARELMAIAGGRLRAGVDHLHKFDHAKYLGAEPPDGDDDE